MLVTVLARWRNTLVMTRNDRPDAELLKLVPRIDAVAALYERHVDSVFRFAVRRCRSPEDVADLVSTVFVELYSAAASYDERRGDARVWLLGIASRCLADQQRLAFRHAGVLGRLAVAPAFEGAEYDRVEAMIDAAQHAPVLQRAITERLSEAERDLLLLVAHDGLTVAQAARVLGVTPVAGRMRLARARRKLRACLGPNPLPRRTRETPPDCAAVRGDANDR